METTTYEKVSEVEFKAIEPQPAKETVYNLETLLTSQAGYQTQIDQCTQAIADLQVLIDKARELEVVTPEELQDNTIENGEPTNE